MTKVIKREFEKLEDLMVKDVSLTCDTSLEVFHIEFNRMSGTDDDLFTYEIEVANILCDSNKDDDSEQRVSHEVDDDMGYDPSHVAFTEWLGGDDEVELTDEESSDNEDEVDETYEEYKDDWIYEWNSDVPWVDEKPRNDDGVWTKPTPVVHYSYIVGNSLHYQDYEWYEALKDSDLKKQALRNKAIMKGLINDDELCNDDWRRWESHEITYHNHDYKHELMMKDKKEEYVAVKEDEYDDLARTSEEACQAYQEIFRMMDEGWMVKRAE
ncbi:hypothetical protein Tco_0382794 [Tanacetum coccineum]